LIHRLVRNILVAEPLVQEFGRCFDGVTSDEADSLAGSFSFERCARREQPAELLRENLTSTGTPAD
jgi:endoglucanase